MGSGLSASAPYLPMFTVTCLNKMDSKMLFSMFKKVWGLSAGTRKLGILGTLGLGFIWSCFVSSVLFLLFYVSLRVHVVHRVQSVFCYSQKEPSHWWALMSVYTLLEGKQVDTINH